MIIRVCPLEEPTESRKPIVKLGKALEIHALRFLFLIRST